MGEQSQPAQAGLALETGRHVVRKRHLLDGRAQHEFAGMQNERLIALRFDETSQLGLLIGRVDDCVFVVVEQTKIPIKAYVNTRRLDESFVKRFEVDPSG